EARSNFRRLGDRGSTERRKRQIGGRGPRVRVAIGGVGSRTVCRVARDTSSAGRRTNTADERVRFARPTRPPVRERVRNLRNLFWKRRRRVSWCSLRGSRQATNLSARGGWKSKKPEHDQRAIPHGDLMSGV